MIKEIIDTQAALEKLYQRCMISENINRDLMRRMDTTKKEAKEKALNMAMQKVINPDKVLEFAEGIYNFLINN